MNRITKDFVLRSSGLALGIVLPWIAFAADPPTGKQVSPDAKPAASDTKPSERPRLVPVEKRWKGQVDVTNDTDVKRRTKDALQQATEAQFPNLTRQEMCEYLSQIHNIPFRFDEGPLLAANAPLGEKKTVVGVFRTMKDVLSEIFPQEVDWMATDDGLFISGRTKIRDTLETRYYDLSILTGAGLKAQGIVIEVADAVKETRGAGGMVSLEDSLLVVNDNQRSQEKILELLHKKLRPILLKQRGE